MATDPNQASQEAREHAQAVFARMSARHRVPAAKRARGHRQGGGRRVDASTQQPQWQAGPDKALPPSDRD